MPIASRLNSVCLFKEMLNSFPLLAVLHVCFGSRMVSPMNCSDGQFLQSCFEQLFPMDGSIAARQQDLEQLSKYDSKATSLSITGTTLQILPPPGAPCIQHCVPHMAD